MLWAALALAVCAVGAGVWAGVKRRPRSEELGAAYVARADRVRGLPGFKRSLRRRGVLLGLTGALCLAALGMCGIVAARPMGTHLVQPENANRDIMLCLDVSGSMTDVDVETIETFEKMLPGFEGERIGMTIFNSSPVQVFPLTDDYDFVERELARMKQSFDYGDEYPEHWAGTLNGAGSSLIGDGLASCVMRFDHEDKQRSRTVLLATDNEQMGEGTVTLDEAAQYATSKKVRSYSINPAEGVTKAQTDELRSAMERTGGESYGLRDTSTVQDVIAQVEEQQAALLAGRAQLVETDRPVLWIALGGVLGIVVLVAVWRVRP